MTTPSLTRTFSLITMGLSLVALTGRADSAANDSFSIGSSGLVPLGLPDRDVVRNPYSGLLGAGGSNAGIQNLGVVGPTLGLGVGFTPGILMGGGGGGGSLPSSLGFSAAPLIGGTSNSGGSTSSTGGSSIGINSPSVLPIVLPPGGGSSSATTNETNFAVPESVPEGGQSVIMFGAGLLMAFFLRRRLTGNKR